MLHALLHGKLSESIPEPDRLEDALTSSVFGTLVLVEAQDVVLEWLRQARDLSGHTLSHDDAEDGWDCWFWPRLAYAEPDLALRIGKRLFIIEAKYRSGSSDTTIEGLNGEEAVSDQLHRQYKSIEVVLNADTLPCTPLETAIVRYPTTLVYLVDQRRMRSVRREFRKSAAAIPDADLRLLTWQRLYVVLRSSQTEARWNTDLLRYLDACGLDAFCGFTSPRHIDARGSRFIGTWRSAGSGTGLVRAIRPLVRNCRETNRRIYNWTVRRKSAGGLRHAISAQDAKRRGNAVCRWSMIRARARSRIVASVSRSLVKTPSEIERTVQGFRIHGK